MRAAATSVAITDPLVKYQSMLAIGVYSPDPAQHRLALHLQKVYRRLKDYSPSVEYQSRLRAVTSALNQDAAKKNKTGSSATLATQSHPIRRNPFFSRFFARTEGQDTLALTRVFTSHEEAISIDSPQGLFVSGEVGTGKTMLLDLLADGLPTSRKRRWHFNTFMLYTLSQLEQYRKTALGSEVGEQYSLLWMGKEMVEKSPILFLDEFQLPDRAASKILSNLFTVFFQLGGVLIASSNRMPEELEKATGFEYTPRTTGSMIGQALGLSGSKRRRGRGELFGSSSDFANFLEVLKARCEFQQMEGGNDWRRRDVDTTQRHSTTTVINSNTAPGQPLNSKNTGMAPAVSAEATTTPRNFFLLGDIDTVAFNKEINRQFPSLIEQDIPWRSTTLIIYGRTVTIPEQHAGVVRWNFDDLVSHFGPADYITMASTFHTFIIDDVPILSILKKNEARRLITLLDALYEARCKLVVRAAAGPDDLFFPEPEEDGSVSIAHLTSSSPGQTSSSVSGTTTDHHDSRVDADAIHSETIAEAYQDQMSPFRPNISSYTDSNNTSYNPDQDSDFAMPSSSPEDLLLRELQRRQSSPSSAAVDFSNTSAFTGEDERFAYKRAASRLWELCGAQWHARDGDGWWTPLPKEARHWERGPSATAPPSKSATGEVLTRKPPGDVRMGPVVELDEPAGLQSLWVRNLREAEKDSKKENT